MDSGIARTTKAQFFDSTKDATAKTFPFLVNLERIQQNYHKDVIFTVPVGLMELIQNIVLSLREYG